MTSIQPKSLKNVLNTVYSSKRSHSFHEIMTIFPWKFCFNIYISCWIYAWIIKTIQKHKLRTTLHTTWLYSLSAIALRWFFSNILCTNKSISITFFVNPKNISIKNLFSSTASTLWKDLLLPWQANPMNIWLRKKKCGKTLECCVLWPYAYVWLRYKKLK